MAKVMTCEVDGGTIMEVTYPTIGRQVVAFGERIKSPITGNFIPNNSAKMHSLACIIAVVWESYPLFTFGFFRSHCRKRAEEWRSHALLLDLSTKGNFCDALSLALANAK